MNHSSKYFRKLITSPCFKTISIKGKNRVNLDYIFFKKKKEKQKREKKGFNCRPHPSGTDIPDRNQTPL